MEQRNSAVLGQNLPELELKDLKPGRELTSKARCLKVLEVLGDGFVLAPTLSMMSREDPRLEQQGEQGLEPTLPFASWLSPGKFPGLSEFQFTNQTMKIAGIICMKFCTHWHVVSAQ